MQGSVQGAYPLGSPHAVLRDAGGRLMEVTAPFDTPLKLWVHTRLLEVEDASGQKLFGGGPNQAFSALRGEDVKSFTVRVRRRKPPEQPRVVFPPRPEEPPPISRLPRFPPGPTPLPPGGLP